MLLDDGQISARLTPRAAVAAMRQAVADAERGVLAAPARVASDLGQGRLIFTTGARAGEWFGYRSYDTFGADPGAQVVVVHDWRTGLASAIAVGHELGRRRTGAIGGVAVDVLARPDAAQLALVGTGNQAWAQLWAVSSVRALAGVRVWSRDAGRRESFARRAEAELGVRGQPGAQRPGRRPRCRHRDPRHQQPGSGDRSLVARGRVSRDQPRAQAAGPGRIRHRAGLPGRCAGDRLRGAGTCLPATVRARRHAAHGPADQPRLGDRKAAPGRTDPGQVTLFCSVGLAGTEVHLLAELAGQQLD